ncbi:YfiR family protein [Plebeiibacterium sediminum]|uniref:YfiR family protein n=1 Tax=Plebeiibacterium sediminum TaxID=2992112 RepID=A0AAE3SGP6_9BACT|nr:YfiR family protein [Plebeiobacterium sediminum]MCW3788327.1 YfiR family protein [Plebeiobacterium sediminum]
MRKKWIVLIMIASSLSMHGQNAMFKALFMFNFAKYIEWPDQTDQKEFIIGVLGNDEIVSELNKLASARKINNKTIVIKNVKDVKDATDSNIFFIPTSKSSNINNVKTYFANKPTLIICEDQDACFNGAGINYTMQGGKMKYEISRQNISCHNLNVDQKLIALGIEIK